MKTKSSKKKLFAALSMALGVMIFTGAAFANYSTANGYNVGKEALKGLLKNENYTMNVDMKVSVDGNEFFRISSSEMYDRDGDVRLNSENSENYYSTDGEYVGGEVYKSYFQNGDEIRIYQHQDGEEETFIYRGRGLSVTGNNGALDMLSGFDEEDLNTVQKIIRFVELAGDTVVGDLKNNVVYVAGDDDSATYELNLDSVQIPELVNAGLSAVFSVIASSSDNDDPLMALGTDPIVKNAAVRFTVDAQGRLTDGNGSVTLSGNGREAKAEMSLKVSDYGTTVPQSVDVSTLKNVHEYGTAVDKDTEIVIYEDGSAHEYRNTVNEDGETVETETTVGKVEIDSETGEGNIQYFED